MDRSARQRRMMSGKETRGNTANQDASASFSASLLMVLLHFSTKRTEKGENADKPKDILTLF